MRCIFLVCVLSSSLFSFAATTHAAALTPVQVGAIISLLASFNVDQTTLTNVWSSLLGGSMRGSVSFISGVQPEDSHIPANAKNIPFTRVMLANNTGSAVTVGGIAVERSGNGNDSALSGIQLLDESGAQIGASRKLDASHQATIGDSFTLVPGQARTLTVAATTATKGKMATGETIRLSIVAVNATAALFGSLPLEGALHTVDTSLSSDAIPQ